ncbi:hypothetical protein KFZ58_00255 [Virgibacillus sp. NKC19-16]|uniref:hypothetical protein n=1 Tax=Virgibacillus salidurans TaxID=2831673 RepID=UPI001F340987|nr:hypothetical protein [Virgibacillus sp. NKC19-16]UJL46455.1 hypothetical protein KFZ58_00255 [Virgibacillus sp. NKC19-16]
MTMVIPVIVVFVISFLLMSVWIYKSERKEHEEKRQIYPLLALLLLYLHWLPLQ